MGFIDFWEYSTNSTWQRGLLRLLYTANRMWDKGVNDGNRKYKSVLLRLFKKRV